MSEIETALDRLGAAVTRLVTASQQSGALESANAAAEARIRELTAECERLRAEVQKLNKQHEHDVKLRAEAGEAVKEALRDLRGLVAAHEGAGGRKQNA